jgi:pilus assembly protein Flp/PilA
MRRLFYSFVADERGATAIEYGLIAGLICLAIVIGVQQVGNAVGNYFTYTGNGLNAAADKIQ